MVVDAPRLAGRVALITGGGRGLGRGHALAFAQQGCSVVVADLGVSIDGRGSDPELAAGVCAEITEQGGQALAVTGDVASSADANRMAAETLDRFGRLDILVNNAGIQRPRWSWEISDEDFDAVLRVNLIGSFNLVRACIPPMKQRGYGRIINITSSGALGHPLQASYAASKSAVIGLTYTCAVELEGSGITVNAFGPSALTRMASAAASMSEEEIRAVPVQDSPFLVYLASEQSAGVNGQLFMHTPGGFALYQKPSPIAEMVKPDGPDGPALWTPDEVAARFATELQPALVAPGHLNQYRAYIEKMLPLIETGVR
jgi:NAD(P)-dependent dehydrogenase (short-subunit alcohol dehydrogenase family)